MREAVKAVFAAASPHVQPRQTLMDVNAGANPPPAECFDAFWAGVTALLEHQPEDERRFVLGELVGVLARLQRMRFTPTEPGVGSIACEFPWLERLVAAVDRAAAQTESRL